MLDLHIEVLRQVNCILFAVELDFQHAVVVTRVLSILQLPEFLLEDSDVGERGSDVVDGGGHVLVHFLELLHVLFFGDAFDVEHFLAEDE